MNRNITSVLVVVVTFFLLSTHVAQSQIITTIASGTNIGDGGPATNAALGGPSNVAFDDKGNTYVLDAEDYRIRKIDANGVITTFAGDGELGTTGDGGPATSARLFVPRGLAVDVTGNVYYTDSQFHRVRKIDLNGIITTVAGTTSQGAGGDGGLAKNAQLNFPQSVATDKLGNLYIADSQNHRIRKVDANGVITTVAGSGTAGFSGDGGLAVEAKLQYPYAVTVDATNNLYIADTYNFRIRKVDTNGTITTIAGNGAYLFSGDGGAATDAPLYYPFDVAVDASGNVYVSQQDSRVRKVTTAGTILPVAGNGTNGFAGDGGLATNALISSSVGVKFDAAGTIYIADRDNYRIRRITSDGIINTIAGGFTGDGGAAINAFFQRRLSTNAPADLTVDDKGNVYIMDRFANRIRKVSPNGIISTVAGNGVNGYTGDGGLATDAQLRHPRSARFDSLGNLYIADQYNSRIRRIDTNNVITTIAGNGIPYFVENRPGPSSADIYNHSGMAVTKSGISYIPITNCILKIMPTGVISVVAGLTASSGYSGDGGLATNAQLNNPRSVALDGAGNFYIADAGNNRIRKVDANGIISTVAGNGSGSYGGENVLATDIPLSYPSDVVFDHIGNMYVSESGFKRVRKVDKNGMMTTVAGTGASGFSGDGGLATNASLNQVGIAVDAAGNLYIADTGNRRVRKVTYPVQVALTVSGSLNGQVTSVTLTATPTGRGFGYQFGPGATQIGNTNQAIVTATGVYSVTVTTSMFGSPAGAATINVSDTGFYTVKSGNWNDPTVWASGQVPSLGQKVRILHLIDVPPSYRAQAGILQYEGGNLRVGTGAVVQLAP